jgi:hypothetical protein
MMEASSRARSAIRVALLAVHVGGLVACVHTYEQFRTAAAPTSPPLVAATAGIYVAVPGDGRYGDREYLGSGRMTANALDAAFARHAARVTVAPAVRPIEDVLADARNRGFSYVVYPVILHWEDRATEWSGKPDRITVKITLIVADSGKIHDEVMITGKSRWATFGGDHPEDLLPEPIGQYVSRLYGHSGAK